MSTVETLRGELITLRTQQSREAQSRLKAYYATGPGIGVGGLGFAPGLGSTIPGTQGWFPIFGAREPFTGAWQRNIVYDQSTILAFFAVYSCITLIAQDIGKLRIKLVEQQVSKWWKEINSPAYSPLLRKPNQYQNRIKFLEFWIACKLIHGNAYALKARDERNIVDALYILNPCNTRPLVSPDGSVFYQTSYDNLSTVNVDLDTMDDIPDGMFIIPAREIIHDPMACIFHPLIGVSPLFACGAAAMKGSAIDESGRKFFENGGQPGGILTAPGAISDSTADRLKAYWDNNFTGANAGKVAVVGDNLKYERLTMSAEDAQTIETMKMTGEQVCSTFHVPPYMIGLAPLPATNIEAAIQFYYSTALQPLIESFELAMDEGLSLVTPTQSYGVELDLKGLLRMDTAARYTAHGQGVGGGWLKPDEARLDEDLPPVPGGNTPYMQQQQFSLGALAERDQDKPFAKPTPAPAAAPAEPEDEDEEDQFEAAAEQAANRFMRELTDYISQGIAA